MSGDFKDEKTEKPKKEEKVEEQQKEPEINDNDLDETRLFLMNFPFGITKTVLRVTMEKYMALLKKFTFHLMSKFNKPKGIGFVKYSSS